MGRDIGRVAFTGPVHYTKGLYVGVIMDDTTAGKNTGFIKGKEYFQCSPKQRGLMVPLVDVRLI
jgi:dynactin complex subunit